MVFIAFATTQQKEKKPREEILFNEFNCIIEYLNQFLPDELRIMYIPFDMARCAKEYVLFCMCGGHVHGQYGNDGPHNACF